MTQRASGTENKVIKLLPRLGMRGRKDLRRSHSDSGNSIKGIIHLKPTDMT